MDEGEQMEEDPGQKWSKAKKYRMVNQKSREVPPKTAENETKALEIKLKRQSRNL